MTKVNPPQSPSSEQPLKILMLAPTSFFSDYGGHIRILEETLALQKRGHKIAIVTYYKGRDLDGIDIRRTAPLPYHTDYEVGSSRHKLAFDVYLAAKSLREALRWRPDVIHGHMHEGALIGVVLARLLRIPLVFDFQGSLTGEMVDHGFVNPQGRIFRWLHRLESKISRWPDAVLTSSLQAQTLLKTEFGVTEKNLVPLPDCVDMRRFDGGLFSAEQKQALRQQLAIPPDRIIVAYLGLLADYQGTDHLVRAAALLKERGEAIHFLIMGYPHVPRYQLLAEQLGVSDYVTFTGKVQYDDAPLYLSLGDIAVSAKMSATEGSGKVLNYMAMGQPVVAYDSAVHREYLAEFGIFAPAGDVERFSAEIAYLANNKTKRQQLGNGLHQRAQTNYSWDAAAARIGELYQRLRRGGGMSNW